MSIVDNTTLVIGRAGAAGEVTASGAVWYAVQVKRFEEHRVVRYLTVKPIPTLLPSIESRRRSPGGRAAVQLEPLFPGYLFVQ